MITIRVPLAEPPPRTSSSKPPVAFGEVDARTWNMEGRDGQTWTAQSMGFVGGKPAAPPAPHRERQGQGPGGPDELTSTTSHRPVSPESVGAGFDSPDGPMSNQDTRPQVRLLDRRSRRAVVDQTGLDLRADPDRKTRQLQDRHPPTHRPSPARSHCWARCCSELLGVVACSQGPNEEAGEAADTAYEQSTTGTTDLGQGPMEEAGEALDEATTARRRTGRFTPATTTP